MCRRSRHIETEGRQHKLQSSAFPCNSTEDEVVS
jgi:hypothetical protein